MKIAYICSPLRGDIENNIMKAHEYCNYAVECGYIPLAPHTIFTNYLDDMVPDQRMKGLEMGLEMLRRSDEIWVCGDAVSQGMQGEIQLARELKIPMLYVSPQNLEMHNLIRQNVEPLTYKDCLDFSLDVDVADKILVLRTAQTSDDSLWKLSNDANRFGDLFKMENVLTGEVKDISRFDFMGTVKPYSLYLWTIDNPVRDELVDKNIFQSNNMQRFLHNILDAVAVVETEHKTQAEDDMDIDFDLELEDDEDMER